MAVSSDTKMLVELQRWEFRQIRRCGCELVQDAAERSDVMPNEHTKLMFEMHHASREKYIYFVLAAAGAAIALAINQTLNSQFIWMHYLWILAVFSWAASFFLGIRSIVLLQSIIYIDVELIKIYSGTHHVFGANSHAISAAGREFESQLNRKMKTSVRYLDWQVWLLWIGGVFYIGWHILNMVLRVTN